LSEKDAADALVKPIQGIGADIEPDAVKKIISYTQGYPYFIQEWGAQVWNLAPASPITAKDVDETSAQIVEHLDANFFRVRFDRLSTLHQKYLRAMAELGPGPYKTGAIAETLGVDAKAVAPVRQQLIDKGMVWSQRHGETAFTALRWSRKTGQGFKVGSPLMKDGPDDWQTQAVLG